MKVFYTKDFTEEESEMERNEAKMRIKCNKKVMKNLIQSYNKTKYIRTV